MANYVRELQVSRLSAGARNRLIQCITGRAAPRPLWAQPVEPDARWKFLVIAGLVLLVGAVTRQDLIANSWHGEELSLRSRPANP